MQTSTTTFSIIIPTYNRAHIIERSIGSVLAQTFTDFELIIVDDGSTDNTREAVALIQDPRLYYLYQENRGVSTARNIGITHAKGKYITFLDSDDEALPGWLYAYATMLLTDEAIGIVCSGCLVTAPDEVILPRNMGPLFHYHTGLFLAGTFVVRCDLLQLVNGYIETLRFGENTELGLRLVHTCRAHCCTVATLAEPLIVYHNSSSLGGSLRDNRFAERLACAEYMLQAHQGILREVPRELLRYYEIAGVNAARIGKGQVARRFFLQAICQNPWHLDNYGRIIITLFPYLVRQTWIKNTKGQQLRAFITSLKHIKNKFGNLSISIRQYRT